MQTTLSLFNAFYLDLKSVQEGADSAEVQDIMAMMLEYNYAPSPDLMKALKALGSKQRGHVFVELGAALKERVGSIFPTSPLYRQFPNHEIVPLQLRFVLWFARHLGVELVEFDPAYYGADPLTGFQTEDFTTNPDLDAEFSVKLASGKVRRGMRFLQLADKAFVERKVVDMMSNLTPASQDEKIFIQWAFTEVGVDLSVLEAVRFREKLPLLWSLVTPAEYAAVCNSVTDVLRLAAHLSGPTKKPAMQAGKGWSYMKSTETVEIQPDLSLKTASRFKLRTSETKALVDLLEVILVRGNTDHRTDFLRHEEPWKRLAQHVRFRQYAKRAPNLVKALELLLSGELRSWESRYANASALNKIYLAKERPGVFVRRLAALHRDATREAAIYTDNGRLKGIEIMSELNAAAREVFPKVDAMKLLQLYVHITRTVKREDRFHSLPKGTMLHSVGKEQDMAAIATILREHLAERLAGIFEWSKEAPALAGTFVPSANRAASQADVRTSRGDRVKLDMPSNGIVRAFLHWKHRADVDLSVLFCSPLQDRLGVCSYYQSAGPAWLHSGDITNGEDGAAEYVDIDIAKAQNHGVRYAMIIANVYYGPAFREFPCYVGAMIRDGETGDHFEPMTVETKLSLDSDQSQTTVAILDLATGELIYADMKGQWSTRTNLDGNLASARQQLDYLANFREYRPTFEDVMQFAGTDGAAAATPEDIRNDLDGVLAKLAAA